MDSKIKKLVATVALAGAVTVGSAGAAVAAEGGSTGSDPSAQAGTAHPGLRRAVRRATVGIVADTLEVSRQQLRDALRGGQSISDYATSLGKEPQDVANALVNAANAKLDQLVAAGKLRQDRADTIKGKVPARVDTLMNRHFGQSAPATAPS